MDAELFEDATAWVVKNGADLPTAVALELYGLFKQATCGDCRDRRPLGFRGAAKWDAWKKLEGCPEELAKASYVEALERYAPEWQGSGGKAKGNGELSLGPAVSTMARMGDGDVDETPAGQLCQEIAEGRIEAACRLLKGSPSLAAEADKDGMLPLHWAADRGDLQMVKFLLDLPAARAAISAADASGDTPLHYAVLAEHEGVAKLLVAHGADVNLPNEAGETCLELAEQGGLSLT